MKHVSAHAWVHTASALDRTMDAPLIPPISGANHVPASPALRFTLPSPRDESSDGWNVEPRIRFRRTPWQAHRHGHYGLRRHPNSSAATVGRGTARPSQASSVIRGWSVRRGHDRPLSNTGSDAWGRPHHGSHPLRWRRPDLKTAVLEEREREHMFSPILVDLRVKPQVLENAHSHLRYCN